MPERRAALERLSRRFGIAPDYHDMWGVRHVVADENLVALLAAFDVDASSDAAIAAAEHAAEAATWREALPPVATLTVGDAHWPVTVRLPQSTTTLRWTIEVEAGEQLHGEADTASLPCTAQAELDGIGQREWRLEPGVALPAGYHRLQVDGAPGATLLIAAPPRCHRPSALEGDGRVWGPALQLYALRSEQNWGIGDFGDLARVIEQWASRGAGIVGLNPLHAMFAHNPAHASPYSPSSRRRLNPQYIDVEAIDDMRECELAQRLVRSAQFQARLEQLRDRDEVDYPGVAAAKREVLELLYAHFRARHLSADSTRAQAFRAFQHDAGDALRQHALYEAIQAHLHAQDASVWGWPVWPEAWREPASPAVQRYAQEQVERVEFHEYLQWQAEHQLGRLCAHCRARGLAIGLYLDLAVSVDRAGSDTWSHAHTYASDASVGAPPDDFNRQGQNWGLPPLRPDHLRASGYRVFIDTLRANMRHAGALRIDHVMGLVRLFWIPPARGARDGAYVHYRADELLAIVALESQRNHCLVIGEDLGTVPDEIRHALAERGVLSYRLMYFERDGAGALKPPGDYPRDALVAVSTHDLPPLAGWWEGRDIEWRYRLGLLPDPQMADALRTARRDERRRLLEALQRAGLAAQADVPPLEAAHAYLGATPSAVMMLQLEDVLGVVEQANLPGTVDEHPNWRRKLPCDLDAMAAVEPLQRVAATLARLRPHAPLRPPASRAVDDAPVPRATYRLQLHHGFTFDDAVRVLPYLARLGVSHVYCSPITRARAGSLHGYDVIAHDEINPELGGRDGFERFSAALRAHGLGLLLDLVPNHMSVFGDDNMWWSDVLENGPASIYAQHFDIDWHPLDRALDGKVLLPVLGDHYGHLLDRGELRLAFEPERGGFALRYHEHRFPLDVRGYADLLRRVEPADAAWRDALQELAAAFAELPPRDDALTPDALASRALRKERLKARLAALAAEHAALAQRIDDALAPLAEADALHALLETQAWRLTYWRVASDEINYRRFFDINALAALRLERKAVFEATQSLALELAAVGAADGLRIDHPDGLRDPAQYFRRVQQGYARRAGMILPEAPEQRPARPLYLVAEKIAAAHEDVPEAWAVHGTTGYRFASVVNGLFVDGTALAKFDRIWRGFTKDTASFDEHAYAGRRTIMRSALASELTVLTAELLRIARADRRTRDYTSNTLRLALAEVAACMPVYRTYIADAPSVQDRRYIDWAVAQARRRSPAADASIFDFVRRALLGDAVAGAAPALRERALRWAVRFQQFSAPVAAKGVEDTAFYRYTRLASLNEVGGDPAHFGVTVRAFHGASADRCARWPHTILATSTHDHKRSEDVRNRIDVLSEMPAVWRLSLRRWSRMTRMHRSKLDDGTPAPAPADEYLLYQTLLGTLPADGLDEARLAPYRERIQQYMLKAAREAKTHTSWINPDEAYETALLGFVGGLLGRLQPNLFLDDLRVQAQRLAWFGALNSLSTTLLKFTSPGVPDLYQGHEVISLTLVDPDNRQPVDYDALARSLDALEGLDTAQLPALVAAAHDGRAKLWIAWRLLALRRERPALFRDGDYVPLDVAGTHVEHVVAFARRHAGAVLVAIAGRLYARWLGEPGPAALGAAAWADTAVTIDLPDGTRLTDALTGTSIVVEQGRVAVGAAFSRLPVAALLGAGDHDA
jgi:(1->4)-alpha-D-glucan 1-alpha-D-glucosylmutase